MPAMFRPFPSAAPHPLNLAEAECMAMALGVTTCLRPALPEPPLAAQGGIGRCEGGMLAAAVLLSLVSALLLLGT